MNSLAARENGDLSTLNGCSAFYVLCCYFIAAQQRMRKAVVEYTKVLSRVSEGGSVRSVSEQQFKKFGDFRCSLLRKAKKSLQQQYNISQGRNLRVRLADDESSSSS